jgi:ABC-type dipeptide/oligopeptide/nickel transport system permease component
MDANSLEYEVLDDTEYHRLNRKIGVGLSAACYALSAGSAAVMGAATYFKLDSLLTVYMMGFIAIPAFLVVGRLSYALSKEHARQASELESALQSNKKPAAVKNNRKIANTKPQKA